MARASLLPQIPSLPSSNGDPTINAILSVLSPVKEILEIYQGNKGNDWGLDRVVRFQDIAVLDPTTFSGSRATRARIVRISGDVVRSGKIESTDSGTYFDLDNQKIVFNQKINYASKMPGIFMGKDEDGKYKFNIGYDDKGSVKFDSVNTFLGLWSITPNGIGDNLTENSSKIFLDKTNTLIRVGASDSYIKIDGGELEIETSNYVSGVAGAGFHLDPDLLEVGNIRARGMIRTAVFQKDVVSAVGGNLMVRPADVLQYDMVAEDVGGVESLILEDDETFLLETAAKALGETGSTGTIIIEGNETFSNSDILRVKDGDDDEWMTISDATNAPSYDVTRDSGGDYAADSNPAWKRGAAVVNYGQSGDGGVYMTASESNAPYISVFTHAGSPWDTITTRLRLGNLNGFLGYSSDIYGLAVGDANHYIKVEPTNGVRIASNTAAAITLLHGGDVRFSGSSYDIWLYCSETGDQFTINPYTDDVTFLTLGGQAVRFDYIDMYSAGRIRQTSYVDASNSVQVDVIHSTNAFMNVYLTDGGTAKQVSFKYDNGAGSFGMYPASDGDFFMGTSSLGLVDVYSYIFSMKETTTPSAVGSVGKVYTKSDNKLYFQDGAGTEYTVDITSV